MITIRPYHPSDLPALYRICLLTADNGGDASHLYSDPELLGHFYAGPYAVFEPDLAFVLVNDQRPIGYMIGARDSATFGRRCEADWFPLLRQRYPLSVAEGKSSAEQGLIKLLHEGHETVNAYPDYPAHLHIDILPEGQKQGFGLKLMEQFWQRLREVGAPGVTLGVSAANANAVSFYRHIGYEEIEAYPWGFALGKKL